MNAKDAIQYNLKTDEMILTSYLADLNDADLLLRPVAGQNHIAWQIGHLIGSERKMVEGIKPGSSPPLPGDYEEGHGRESAHVDDPSKYYGKDRYLELFQAQRAATRKVLDGLTESDLDAPNPDERMRDFSPTVGTTMMLIGQHVLMHVGQFVSVRRFLKKPVTM